MTYRGTIAYDEPLWANVYRIRLSLTGKRNDPTYNLARKRAWRARNREKYNAYHREDMRKRRKKLSVLF